MKWEMPPKIKIYEALGCMGDGRIKIHNNSAVVTSSSGNKAYTVTYDPESKAIMANDNGSFWRGYLGYPSIAFLMAKQIIAYNAQCAKLLVGIPWKDINTKFKNDWDKTEQHVLGLVKDEAGLALLKADIDSIYDQIKFLEMKMLGNKAKPPVGY